MTQDFQVVEADMVNAHADAMRIRDVHNHLLSAITDVQSCVALLGSLTEGTTAGKDTNELLFRTRGLRQFLMDLHEDLHHVSIAVAIQRPEEKPDNSGSGMYI